MTFLAILAGLFPAVALAHPGHEGDHDLTWGFSTGVVHPLTGWDHLLAMVAIGLWANQMGGRFRWLVPSVFMAVMALGAFLGHGDELLPGVDQAIAATLLVLGLMVATAKKLPLGLGLMLTAFFAVFHGVAHGAELPAHTSGWTYGLGFLITTALLHGAGLALGRLGKEITWFPPVAGAGVALAGLVILVG